MFQFYQKLTNHWPLDNGLLRSFSNFRMPILVSPKETFSRSRSRDRDVRRGQGELMGLMGLMAAKKGVNLFGLLPVFFFKDTNHQGKRDLFFFFVFFFCEVQTVFFWQNTYYFCWRGTAGTWSGDDVHDKSLESKKTWMGLICRKGMCLVTRSCWPVFLNTAGYESI